MSRHAASLLFCSLLALGAAACSTDDLNTKQRQEQDAELGVDANARTDLDAPDLSTPDASSVPDLDVVQPGEEMGQQPDMMIVPDPVDMAPVEPLPSRCTLSSRQIDCTHQTLEVDADGIPREVHWELPAGTPPQGGWPAVIFFQGSLFSSQYSWDATEGAAYGAYHLTRTFKALLDGGYAVLAPEARFDGSTYWDTNIFPYSSDWESSRDHQLMLSLFAAMEQGAFGQIDTGNLFAMGISSGGYMTSRMAVSYPGRFRALAIASGSYATCGGYLCSVPDMLPEDHPPTLFLHGDNDLTVPISTMRDYDEELVAEGHTTRVVIDEQAGHEWLPAAEAEVPAWFDRYR